MNSLKKYLPSVTMIVQVVVALAVYMIVKPFLASALPASITSRLP